MHAGEEVDPGPRDEATNSSRPGSRGAPPGPDPQLIPIGRSWRTRERECADREGTDRAADGSPPAGRGDQPLSTVRVPNGFPTSRSRQTPSRNATALHEPEDRPSDV